MLVVHMPQQFPFSGVFSTTNVADKFLFWSTTLLPGTSGDVLDQAGLLSKGSPTMRTGSEPAFMLFSDAGSNGLLCCTSMDTGYIETSKMADVWPGEF